jgi:hypothetical protein
MMLMMDTEGMLTKDNLIASAILFGRGRFNVGVLINPSIENEPAAIAEFDLLKFRDRIW